MSIYNSPSWTSDRLILSGGDYFAAMSRDQFFDFCRRNPDVSFERTAEGDLVITTPAGSDAGRRNMELSLQVALWSKNDGTGVAFDSSTGFWLPNGAMRSPDASWVRRERWDALSRTEQKKFAPLAPDFVVELRSETDRMAHLRDKMQEYAENGVRLGWLIDPVDRRVEVYRPGRARENLEAPTQISADPELPGFTLDLSAIW
jgi:Uma2 family endonuclease